MTRLGDLVTVCRSKNSGPFVLVLDTIFKDRETFERVRTSGVLSKDLIGELYKVSPDNVRIIEFSLGNAIKIAIPRLESSGDAADTDVYGAQQHVPLLGIEIP